MSSPIPDWDTDRVESVIHTLNPEQLELFTIIFLLHKRSEKVAEHALGQSRRLFNLLGDDSEYDIDQDWKEADHDWDREEPGSVDETTGIEDDGSSGTRREPEGDASPTVEQSTED